jgi:subtilisin-like proprotein convertase family protein
MSGFGLAPETESPAAIALAGGTAALGGAAPGGVAPAGGAAVIAAAAFASGAGSRPSPADAPAAVASLMLDPTTLLRDSPLRSTAALVGTGVWTQGSSILFVGPLWTPLPAELSVAATAGPIAPGGLPDCPGTPPSAPAAALAVGTGVNARPAADDDLVLALPEAIAPAGAEPAVPAPEDSPLFQYQWYLVNTGQPGNPNETSGGTSGVDINVLGAWSLATGTGVSIVVNDTGIDYTNANIAPNFDAATSASVDPAPSGGDYADYYPYDTVGYSESDYEDLAELGHGTTVASLIAGADNGTGIVGVAYDASISAYRVIDTKAGDENVYTTLEDAFANEITNNFDVANNSWEITGSGEISDSAFNSDEEPVLAELVKVAETGRGGLGTINVFAGGNGYADGDDTNLHAFQSSINGITVAAVDDDGTVGVNDSTYDTTRFSSPGASILVSAPGVDMTGDDIVAAGTGWKLLAEHGVVGITDEASDDGDVETAFGLDGTSFAAPLVSGVVALMLQANPDLGLVDVQQILAYTATETDPSDSTWITNDAGNWNGGGLHVSRDYGFGLLDATAAVALAANWPLQQTVFGATSGTPATIDTVTLAPSGGSSTIGTTLASFTLTVPSADDLTLDFARLQLTLNYPAFSHLTVTFTSPGGTSSVLLDDPGDGLGAASERAPFQLTSDQFWGESSAGNWTLSISGVPTGDSDGQLASAVLVLEGTPVSSSDLYVYTDEYASGLADDPTRGTLNNPSGTQTIDIAACSGDCDLDLNAGTVSTIDGADLTVAAGTTVTTAICGLGEDTVIGNDDDDDFVPGSGDDTFTGGSGLNTVDFSHAAAAVSVDLATGTADNGYGGTDSLANIETVVGSTYGGTLIGGAAAATYDVEGGTNIVTAGSGGAAVVFSDPRSSYVLQNANGTQITVTETSDPSAVTTLNGAAEIAFSNLSVLATYEPAGAADGILGADLWVTRVAALTGASQGPALPPPAVTSGVSAGGSDTPASSSGGIDVALLSQMSQSSAPAAATVPAAASPAPAAATAAEALSLAAVVSYTKSS